MSTRRHRRSVRVLGLALAALMGSLLAVGGLAGRQGEAAGKYVISGGTVGAPIYAVGGLLAGSSCGPRWSSAPCSPPARCA